MSALKEMARRVLRLAARLAPPALLLRAVPAGQRFGPAHSTPASVPPSTPTRVLIGPTNTAGQGWAIARSLEQLDGVGACSFAIVPDGGGFGYPVDQGISGAEYRWSARWQRAQRQAVLSGFTHVLLESGRPLFGDPLGRTVDDDLRALERAGITTALYFHGSELRLPSRHRARIADSPFQPGLWNLTPTLEAQARRMAALAEGFGGPVFVSTPDLLVDLPDAMWLPVQVDPDAWQTTRPPFSDPALPPIVAHVPSKAVVKGTDLIEPLLLDLHEQGVIRYTPVQGLRADQMPDAYRSADIVLDQFRIATYGVAACEAMAAGRVVISNVGEQVRGEVASRTGEHLPIVESAASQLGDVLREVLRDRDRYVALAAQGPEFVRALHDGRLSTSILAENFLHRR